MLEFSSRFPLTVLCVDQRFIEIDPHNITYNAAIRVACRLNDQAAALDYIELMKEQGFHRTAATYNPLITTCTNFDDMLMVAEVMASDGVDPNAATYNLMVSFSQLLQM